MDAAGWDARYAGTELVWGAEPNRFVVQEFTGVPPGRLLDVAAGEGRNAVWLAGLGWRVTAVDFSPVAIERGRLMAADRNVTVDWVVADVREYQPQPQSFDAVLVAYLHLAHDELTSAFAHAAAAVAPGGRIVVVGHDLANLTDGVGGPKDPDVLYTPELVSAALPGLTIRSARKVTRPVPTDNGTVDAIDTLVVAERTLPAEAPQERALTPR